MKKGLCEIVFLLDMTGSMQPLKNDAIGGFNSFIEGQKKVPGQATVTLILFNSDETVKPFESMDINTVPLLTDKVYKPNGMTPLLDAMGFAIDEVGKRLEAVPEVDRPEKVMFAVMTDGEENYSHMFTLKQIYEKVKHQTDVYKWEFAFLGANIDAFAEANKLGISACNAATFVYSKQGFDKAYDKLKCVTTGYRMS